jgi:hypothetical protein
LTIGNLLARIRTNVTNVDAKVLRRVGVNTMQHIAICLKPLWFHCLIPCAIWYWWWWWCVSRRLSIEWNRGCIFWLIFKKELEHDERVHESRFIL